MKRHAIPQFHPAAPKTNEDGSPAIDPANGQPIMEEPAPVMEDYKVKGQTKQRQKIVPTRLFAVKTVEAGKVYGKWTAPSNGALVQRTQ